MRLMSCWTKRLAISVGLTGLASVGMASAAEISLPPYPFWPNSTFLVDESLLTGMAADYCAAAGPGASSVDFYLGVLPLRSIDLMGENAAEPAAEALLGNLYVSGYFGGLWLRDVLESTDGTPLTALEADVLARMGQVLERAAGYGVSPDKLRTARSGAVSSPGEQAVFRALTASVGREVDLAQNAGRARVQAANRSTLAAMLSMYGYNLGYLQVLLENPPPGAQSVEGVLQCGEFLDCRSPDIDLAMFDEYQGAIEAVADPSNPRWRTLAAMTEKWGVGSVEEGRAVWEDILSESTIAAPAYDALVDLSVGFLLVSDAAVLAGMTAWGDHDAGAGRSALLIQGGLIQWAGSYFMGLASSAPAGTFPTLVCP